MAKTCYCAAEFGQAFAASLEECPRDWCGLRNYHEAIADLKRLDEPTYRRHHVALDESLMKMTEVWVKKRGRNRSGGIVEKLLRKVFSQEGIEVLSGPERTKLVTELEGLFRPDLVVRVRGTTTIVESTTWANPDKLRGDFFKGYVAAKKGIRLVSFMAGLEARFDDNDPGFQKVAKLAQSDGYLTGFWGIRNLGDLIKSLRAP